ncbi:MbnP family protein [Sphingobacterium endophyticum]|uniref:MbnP family protein n=1 Tax=Sphingobacterium endophyticum TaxID=2546448 RepID=UPI0012E12DDF|nr:MbnP family protein [Sphingobacterium endophyticum]
MKANLILCSLMAVFTLFSCQKDNIEFDNNKTGQLKLKFDHIVNGKTLTLKNSQYSNSFKETYNIDLLKYYVSNIKLTDDKGKVYTVPKKESFFLIDASNSESLFPKFKIPEGNYTKLEFILGVDSATSVLPKEDRTGVLDIEGNDMYWSWNSGYIFFKMEGESSASKNANKRYAYHIGLFGGYDPSKPTKNNLRTVALDLKKAGIATVQEGLSSDIHLMVDLGQVLDGPNKIKINEFSTVMVSGPNDLIANNYSGMFTHDHTHNFQKIANE